MDKNLLTLALESIHDRICRFGSLARALDRVGIDMKDAIVDQTSKLEDYFDKLDDIYQTLCLSKVLDDDTLTQISDDIDTFNSVCKLLDENLIYWIDSTGSDAISNRLRAAASEGSILCMHLRKAIEILPAPDRRQKKDSIFKGNERRKKDRRNKNRD